MNTGMRLAAIGLAAILPSSACVPAPPNSELPYCDEFSVLVLEAQSVPTAQLIPCFESMPSGWEASFIWIDSDGSNVILDSDLAGAGAAEVELREECDVTGYVQVPTDELDTERYQVVEDIGGEFRSRRTYLFDGGCTTLTFHFDAEASPDLVSDISRSVGFVPRSTLNETIRSITDGREQLDPPTG
jgi:hypothetical protein